MGSIVDGLIGGSSSGEKILKRFRPTGLKSSGLNANFVKTGKGNRGFFDVQRGAGATSAIDNIIATTEARAGEFRGLREQVRPGFGRLTEARVNTIRDAGKRRVGSLRAELSKRRVLGSRFAEDQITSTELDFAREEETARAEAFLQELGVTAELINQEYGSIMEGLQTELGQLNFETSVGAQLASTSSQLISQNLMAQAESRQIQDSMGAGFFNSLLEIGGTIAIDKLT